MDTRTIKLGAGTLRVIEKAGLLHARGVRYATAERFAPPQPVERWDGIVDALERGAACPQRPSRLAHVTGPPIAGMRESEDCLTVTVTAPAEAQGLPVMVWFHGGAYLSGSGEAACYEPSRLTAENDVVVVTVNHRLGIFGYLPIDGVAPANLGLLDQILALRWVRDNVAAFGGDPSRVTAFGQSAGADSIYCLMLAVGDESLFGRAILQSAPLGMRLGRGPMVAAMCAAATRAVGDPRHASVEELLRAQDVAAVAAAKYPAGAMAFGPLLGHDPLPGEATLDAHLRQVAPTVELLIVYNRDDALPFVNMIPRARKVLELPLAGRLLRGPISRVSTAKVFGRPADRFATAWARAGGRVSRYRFDWRAPDSDIGAGHAIELAFLLDDPSAWSDAPMLGDDPDSAIEAIAPTMRRAWADFARDGANALPAGRLIFG